ncbi:hypothetical protein [uncultured Veillonella sp.]|uniref:hypothetical protein n=1 Tax=uncultured Veillonella sp. TaxID=159268 RepID=UPI002628C275|nr:hypothetical protein [uncultured Veillonella sp.]
MSQYYQNTFLFISRQRSVLQPLLESLQWALKEQVDRLDIPLVHMGMFANMLTDSRNHSLMGYDLYQHEQTKEYILRIHTESQDGIHPIDMEYCRVYLSPNTKLHYVSEGYSECTYINTDISHVYLPIRFKIELYIDETYDINYFLNLTTLQRFLVTAFPLLHIDIFDGIKTICSKINRHIKSLNTNNWCHIFRYEPK